MEVMEVTNGFDSYIALLCFCLGAAVRAHFVHSGLSACKKMERVTSHDQQTYLNECFPVHKAVTQSGPANTRAERSYRR
jgi:hypothetical protein